MKIFIALLFALLLGTTARAQQDRSITIPSGGAERRFRVHFPSESPGSGLPMLLCYHGMGDSPQGMAWLSGLDELADRFNFIVVYPEARKIGADVQWNVYVDAEPGHAGVGDPDALSDVDFTRDIIDYMSATHAIDNRRVYASGFSSGGFMSYALAMQLSDRIAAIAPVAGNLWGDTDYITGLLASGSITPIPVLHVHGTADNDVPYPDPDNRPDPYQEWPLFVVASASGATTYSDVIPLLPGVDRLLFCSAPVEVSLVRIEGMGHDWDNGVYQTSSEIVKFFGLDRGVSAVEPPASSRTRMIVPGMVEGALHLDIPEECTVQIVSTVGTLLYTARHEAGRATVSCDMLSAGIYLVRVVPADRRSVVSEAAVIVR